MYYIILYNILYKTNSFSIAKEEAILLLIKLINKKNLYINIFNKKNLALNKKDLPNTNKAIKMLDKNKNTKILNIKYIIFKKE